MVINKIILKDKNGNIDKAEYKCDFCSYVFIKSPKRSSVSNSTKKPSCISNQIKCPNCNNFLKTWS